MTTEGPDIGPVDALVLAGGINRIRLYQGYSPGYKALLPFGDKPSIRYVLDALEGVPQLGRRVVVGPPELRGTFPHPGTWELLPAGETVMESLFTGLEHLRQSPAVLCTTADLPLLKPVAVTDFLQACARAGWTARGLFWSMVPEHAFTGPFIQADKGFNRFRNIAVCHGNLYLLRPEPFFSSPLGSRLNRLYLARKSTIRAALVFGPHVGLAYLIGVYLLRRLTLERMAAIVSHNLSLEVVPILLERPEIALDVDEPRTYNLVRKLLEN
jgi:molybdopterin-guanine dinucleotide biosynthesis protein A